MWADNETSLDLINVQHLVGGVVDVLRQQALLPVTIGVYGGWGQGKSSLIRMVQEEFSEDEDVVCVTFNGWLFESYDDAKSALMESILEAIGEKRTPTGKALETLQGLRSRIDWFRVMSLAAKGALTIASGGAPVLGADLLQAGIDSAPSLLKEGSESGTGVRTVRGFRAEFKKLLEETGISTLVVFIDELDRCLPNAVVETLEAIRLFLFVEGTAFVIGADEDLVRHAVDRRFQRGEMKASVGGAYLEKMVQIPFRIPPMSPRAMRTYMNLLFTQLHVERKDFEHLISQLPSEETGEFGELQFDYDHASRLLKEVPLELGDAFSLTGLLGDVLTTGLDGNPRQLKRFLNMLLLRLDLGKRRGLKLNRRVLGKLMLLEYFHPERFEQLAQWGLQDGRCPNLDSLENAAAEDYSDEPSEDSPSEEPTEESEDDSSPSDHHAQRLNEALRAWLESEHLLNWLRMQPSLGSLELAPYLYITREQSGVTHLTLDSLSPKAAEVLSLLRSRSRASRDKGEKLAGKLSAGEAAAVFRHLSRDIEMEEQLGAATEPPLASVFALCAASPALLTDLLGLFDKLPPMRFQPGVVAALTNALQNNNPAQARPLFEKWAAAKALNLRLATIAERELAPTAGGS